MLLMFVNHLLLSISMLLFNVENNKKILIFIKFYPFKINVKESMNSPRLLESTFFKSKTKLDLEMGLGLNF